MRRLAQLLAALALVLHAILAMAQQATRFPQDYHGLWWNPAESGWGVSVFDQGNSVLSSVIFVYGPDGNPTWYIAPHVGGCAADFVPYMSISCGGKIYQTNGPWFASVPFTPSTVTVRDVGDWSGYFSGPLASSTAMPRELDLTVTIDGATLKRDKLFPQDIQGSGTLNYSPTDSKFTDLWWNPDEPGWGVGIFHYKATIFAVLFVYGPTRQPTWYVASLRETTQVGDTTQRSFDGPIFATRGTWWLTSPFKLSEVRAVGTTRLTFPTDGINASLSYTIDGHNVQTVIRRESSAHP